MNKIALAALGICFALLCTSCSEKKAAPKARPAVPVKVARALQKDIPVQLKAIGTVEAYQSVAVKSQVSGQISRIHFAEGADVEKGALLVSIDPEPFKAALSQCQATLAKDQSQAKFAREQAARYQGLLKDGIIARDQYEMLASNAESLAATLAADRAAIRNAEIQLGYCSIRSPIAGRTGAVTLQQGNLVKGNDLAIVTINQVSPIYVTFSVPETKIAALKAAMATRALQVQAVIPNEPGKGEIGSISFLDNAVNAGTGTIRLKGAFANKSRRLWPGQFTDVVLTLGSKQNAVVVPTHAVQTGQEGEFLYVVKPDRKVEMRRVKTGLAAGELTVIESGLAAGETVVVDGQLRLTPGATVQIKEQGGEKASGEKAAAEKAAGEKAPGVKASGAGKR